MFRSKLRALTTIVVVAASTLSFQGSADAAPPTPVVPYGANGYRYLEVPTGTGDTAFDDVDFDDSAFAVGAAPFGSELAGCPVAPVTPWSSNTDLLVRRNVSLPEGTTDVRVSIAIDNDVEVFWNGESLASLVHEGCPTQDSFVVEVPDGVLTSGDNVLAVRARDRGATSFLDLQVTANLAPDCGSVELSETTLWPPNHKMHTVTASGGQDPEGGAVALTIGAVTQDELLDDAGDGSTAPDADVQDLGPAAVRLRAERSGTGDGRVYRVAVTATDDDGASCSTTRFVGVPHDLGQGREPVDTSPVVVDSFGPTLPPEPDFLAAVPPVPAPDEPSATVPSAMPVHEVSTQPTPPTPAPTPRVTQPGSTAGPAAPPAASTTTTSVVTEPPTDTSPGKSGAHRPADQATRGRGR